MKTTLITLLFFISFHGFTQERDTASSSKIPAVEIQAKANEKSQKSTEETKTPPEKIKSELGIDLWLYVLMPVILSFSSAFYFISWLKREGYRISNALSDDVPEHRLLQAQAVQRDLFMAKAEIIRSNAADPTHAQEIPSVEKSIQEMTPMNRSSSRLIAFLSSMSASILAICIFSYYMYFAVNGLETPEFEDLWTILVALGIGVIPYTTKVINSKPTS